MEVRIELPGVKLGVLEAHGVQVVPADAGLSREMDEVCDRLRGQHTLDSVMDLESIRTVRGMFRVWGVDPARYRPSSEALVRREVQGKGLYRVSNVVDINNLGSIETGWPYGCYNCGTFAPPVTFREAVAGETYEGIGKRTWHLAGRPVLADAAGPFGSPISDSTRTMISEAVRDVLMVIFAPESAADCALQAALDRLAQRLERSAGAQPTNSRIIYA